MGGHEPLVPVDERMKGTFEGWHMPHNQHSEAGAHNPPSIGLPAFDRKIAMREESLIYSICRWMCRGLTNLQSLARDQVEQTAKTYHVQNLELDLQKRA